MLIRQVRVLDATTGAASTEPRDLRAREGVILELGSRLTRAAGEEVHEASGAIALPGLWDQHVHSDQLAQAHARLDTLGAASVPEILDRVRAELARRRRAGADPREAIVGFGHRLVDLAVTPTVAALDAVTGTAPTVLIGGDAHHAWLNSAALRTLGLPRRDGIVAEDDWFALAPRVSALRGVPEASRLGAAVMQDEALARGLVGLVDMEWGRPWLSWPRRSPRLRVRTAVYPAELARAPGPQGTVLDASGLVTMGPLKVILDGALGSHSAFTRRAYSDGHGYEGHGVLSVDPEDLLAALRRAQQLGLTAAVHAIGDAAAQVALDAIGTTGIPARIEHAQMLTDTDISRMARLGVTASVQPAHLLEDRDATESLWPDRAAQAFRLRDLLDAGVPLALGSDAPVAPPDPWLAMAAAVHRSADDRPAWYPQQRIQPREALAASTDGVRTLAPDGVADLVLLEASAVDLFADVPPEGTREVADRLRAVRPLATVVAGRLAASR